MVLAYDKKDNPLKTNELNVIKNRISIDFQYLRKITPLIFPM